jgi:hypothetical protein
MKEHRVVTKRVRIPMKGDPATQAKEPICERQRRSIFQPKVGARHERLPWDREKKSTNPNGVESPGARWMQPFQGWMRGGRVPRVARSSQPWAERWNPVGIQETVTAGTAE